MYACAAGIISFAGNWVGQGQIFSEIFIGMSLFDGSANAASAPAYATWPSSYASMANYKYYGTSEVVIQTQNATGAG